MSGITANGFEMKTYDEIRSDIVSELTLRLGQIDDSPDSPFGQIIDTFTLMHLEIWEQLNAMYQGLNRTTAEGAQLTNIGALSGFQRLGATQTVVDSALLGNNGTTVPTGSNAKTSYNNNSYELVSPVTISRSAMVKHISSISPVAQGNIYSITVNSILVTYTAGPNDSQISVQTALVAGINSNPSLYAVLSASGNGTTDKIYITSKDKKTQFSAVVGGLLSDEELWSYGQFKSIAYGQIACTVGSLDTIETPVSGWLGVTNFLSGQRGRDQEDDISYRFRMGKNFTVAGSASPYGMEAKLSQLENVSTVRVFENPTDYEDSFGRRPHSVNVCIEGGNDADIANAIYYYKASGIDTHGATEVIIADTQGTTYPVRFDRFVDKFGFVRVTILEKNFEEVYPQNGADLIRDAIYEYANDTLSFGDDIITQKFFVPVYSVPGIKSILIETFVGDAPSDTPVWQTANISVAPNEAVRFENDQTRIVIIDATV